jgi:hypothetical protein
MFLPNTRADLYRRAATANNFGRFSHDKKRSVPCGVIYLNVSAQKSSVRADTSGSRGQAEQMEGDARILFPIFVKVNVGDAIFKDEIWLEVIEVEPRRNLLGQLDHYQVELKKVEPIK